MQFANIQWQENENGVNQPYSLDFNDVYFNSESGLQETEYVFVEHNQLKQRFKALKNTHFTIIETGFGTGLNFLAVAAHWLALSKPSAQLHYISIEKFPLSPADFFNAVQIMSQLPSISNPLIAQYENLNTGFNCFKFAHNIELQLHIGDINDVLPTINQPADAWLLDGFAPAKNAEMWSQQVFTEVARLSKAGTTFATFTSAGEVKRGLQSVGFNVQKCAGFGKKREMLSGSFL